MMMMMMIIIIIFNSYLVKLYIKKQNSNLKFKKKLFAFYKAFFKKIKAKENKRGV
jgi:hypothetical protein